MSIDAAPACPQCGAALRAGSMALCRRAEDDRRVCRMVWACSDRHVWWKWADRPASPLEPCPYPDLGPS
ncbi:dehydrogenase [Streptomyces sp. UH6]|uniref:dehydrogenase n=1 Tax=Streptomyces sp. UH6 TaxID=2748379 RepID=UPI0015D48A3F|nr:dehydrogenase [Streptomyces sp. UH6]NYV73974.1 dehydrogenase [Streptomyces sp. UH6]